jgi:hypothetical protein
VTLSESAGTSCEFRTERVQARNRERMSSLFIG